MDERARLAAQIEPLTERELEILHLVADGLSNREIARQMYLSLNTVKWYNKRVFQKLGVSSRTQAAAQARLFGLLGDEPAAQTRRKHNLPAQSAHLLGRESEIRQIGQLLADAPLVTLIGPGGVGKTRLALAVAADQLDTFRDGACFVQLAPINSARAVVQAIIEALGQSVLSADDLTSHLLHYLRNKEMLLVVDNFEHLLDGATLLGDIVQSAPAVKILATSREKLKLTAETAFITHGLAYPATAGSEASILDYSSVKLFLERARQQRPDFTPTAGDLAHISRICQIVEGMPLAVELSAAWVDTLSCAEIAAEIDHNLDVLAVELRDVPARQRSIRAAFDHSWALMSDVERDSFLRLSVFRGGFTRGAAAAVAGASLPVLASLVNKSLLRWSLDSRRYDVHELLRQYGQEQLEQTPDVSLSVREAHAAYYAEFMQERPGRRPSRGQAGDIADIVTDLENIRWAWRYWIAEANAPQIRKMIPGLRQVYYVRGWLDAGRELGRETAGAMRIVTNRDDEAETVLGIALTQQAHFLQLLGLPEQGYALAKESVARLERLKNPQDLFNALDILRLISYYLGRYDEEAAVAQRMTEIATSVEDEWMRAAALLSMSMAAYRRKDFDAAMDLALSGAQKMEILGDVSYLTYFLLVAGHVSFAAGDYGEATECYRRCLDAASELDFRWAMVNASRYLGRVALAEGDFEQAKTYFLQSLEIAEEARLWREIIYLLYNLARVEAAEGNAERAAELLTLVLQHPISREGRMDGGQLQDRASDLLRELAATLPPDSYAIALERGDELDTDAVLTEYLAGRR